MPVNRCRRWVRRRDDRGAVTTVVAMLLATGVLFGFLALVVDVGQIYVERGELQTGADAAALAVAKVCAADDGECEDVGDIRAIARRYANANSPDGFSRLAVVCGRIPGVTTFACPAPEGNRTDCLGAVPDAPTSYVEVRLTTRLPGNRFALPPSFAQAVDPDFDGVSVGACARVRWDAGEDERVLAMTISTCELADAPIGGEPFSTFEQYVIDFRAPQAHASCSFDPPGSRWDRAGRAGWLSGGGSGCAVDLPGNGIVTGGSSPSGSCVARLRTLRADETTIWVPVHDARNSLGGSSAEFRHIRVAPFVVTGFRLGSDRDERRRSTINNLYPCGDDRRCVSGVFVGPSQPLSVLAGDSFVKLIG